MDMGIGPVGRPDVIFKKKHRWTLTLFTTLGTISPYLLKIGARPKLEIDETEINFLNATTWIPGKGKWQPINVTYRDVANSSDMKTLMSWLESIYGFHDPVALKQTEKSGWAATAVLSMFDGCGQELERWTLGSCFPQSIDFGELDYESSEEATIELTLRYSEVNYINQCGQQPSPECRGC